MDKFYSFGEGGRGGGGGGFQLPPGIRHRPPPSNPQEAIAILKEEGNKAIQGDPAMAFQMYSQCIEINNIWNVLSDRDCAIIHSNRSQALMKLGDLGSAFNDAIECVKTDPSYVKGYWRAATVMKLMDRHEDALEALIDGLSNVRGVGQQQLKDRVEFVFEITTLACNLEGKWKKAEFLFRSIQVDTRVWTEVVKRLAAKNEYKGLYLVFLGGGGRYDKGDGGMATGCSTKDLGIRPMLRELSLMQLKDWGVRLVYQLIVHGADHSELSIKDGDTPLHCALMLALSNGWFELLDYLLSKKYTKPQSRNLLDRSGASLYHMVAKSSNGHELRALKSLQEYQVSPNLLDKRSRTPIFYASSEDVKTAIRRSIQAWQTRGNTANGQHSASKPRQTTQTWQQTEQSTPNQQPGQSGGRKGVFQWEQHTQPNTYNAYTGQPYWEAQQQQRSEAPWENPQLHSEIEIVRQRQAQISRKQEEDRRIREEEQRMKKMKQKEEERQRKEAEKMAQRRRADELRRQKREEENRIRRQREEDRKEKKRRQKENKAQKRNQEEVERAKQESEVCHKSLYQQGLHHAEHNQPVQAVTCYAQFINENHDNQFQLNDVERCRKAFAKEMQNIDDLPPDLEFNDNPECWKPTIDLLASEQKWKTISKLMRKGGYAHGCDSSNISIASFLKAWNKSLKIDKMKFVLTLLEQKARPNGLLNEEHSALQICVKNHNYDMDMILLLLQHGAYPTQLTINQGDTALHAALKIGFTLSDRKFKILNLLLEKYTDPSGVPYLNPSLQDADGNGLFHIAIKDGTKNLSLEAVKLLSKYKVNPQLANKKGEIALQMVKRNDRRYPFLTQAASHHPKVAPKSSGGKGDHVSTTKQHSAAPSPDGGGAAQILTGDSGIRVSDTPSGITPTRTSWKDQMKREIAVLIDVLPPFVAKRPRVEESHAILHEVEDEEEQASVDERVLPKDTQGSQDDAPDAAEVDEEDVDADDDDKEELAVDVHDPSLFDNLTWEVECTAKTWKVLRDRHVAHKLKEGIIRKIQLLGNGNWRARLCKQLDGLPRERDMKLYEAKLTRGGRILWELAIAFSPRCSEESEKRLGAEDGDGASGSTPFAVAGGRIYSEIIRIWDIVFDHDNLARTIETVVKSYERGKECIIQKKLVGIGKMEFTAGKTTGQRVPMFYRETGDGNSPQKSPTKKNQPLVDSKAKGFFPPASSKENEYHIMKFYSFNSSLVNAILTDSSVKVDFPFRVTELEHAIINLQPKQAASVLLLGRSGTGKTTCCLYRLWTAFVRYWKMAASAGEPLIERDVAFVHRDETEEDEDHADGDDDNDEDYETCSDTSDEDNPTASSSTNCRQLVTKTSSTSNSAIQGDEEETEEEDERIMDHLHQIFITKNAVLCSEVRRNFRDLSHACEFAQEHCEVEDNTLPTRLQDAHPALFPLFLNSRQWLLMLDGSLPNPYFPRNEDGSLKRKIHGWGKDEGPLDFIPVIEDEDEESDGEESADDATVYGDIDGAAGAPENDAEKVNVKFDPRCEVTYEVFAYKMWQKINKKTKLPYHPTLVWMEITSFIKGSIEALHTDKGHLAEEGYQELGRKRAPNFTADRGKIYRVYEAYEHEKRQRNLFDEADLVYHIYRRMRDIQRPDWAVHQFYVDETQDFTQAELSLIIRCCHDPNALFLTGDTAQSIMRGVAFRFDDLRSLFHYASKSVKALGKHSAVRVPKRVYQLTHNYRSHAGILNLACSVVDLMFHFFPNSFDRLDRDQGLFDGPSPVLLESCSFSDLALLLRGNKRKTSEIEFGAHQVILVANEEAKERLPAELSLGLVLTIFEAKGLEFDDVLLYNIFKDSPADKEWRVIRDYLDELIEEYEVQRAKAGYDCRVTNLHSIDIEDLNAPDRPRPLKFDPDKHKVLNSELKYLYTAITRARVNVWIFDEDVTKRAPIFEYFRRLRLVKVVRPDEVDKGGNSELDTMFVEASTKEEWDKKGDYFYEHKLWLVAVKCYRRAGDEKKELKAEAHHRALEADRLRDQPNRMREEFLAAARAFLQCGDLGSLAAKCLFNAKEYFLSAQLFEKMGEMQRAAKIFENRAKRFADASRCYEQSGDYAKAIELLAMAGMHIKAADVVERFNDEYGVARLPSARIKPPRASDTVENLCHQAANYHHRNGNIEKMKDALNQLPKFDDRINFLKKKGRYDLAVGILKEEGMHLEAAQILRSQGKFEKACEGLDSTTHAQFIGECHLARARRLLPSTTYDIVKRLDDTVKKLLEEELTEALDMFRDTKDTTRHAEAQMLLGIVKSDTEMIKTAKTKFIQMRNPIGEVHAADHLLQGLALPKYDKMRAVFTPLQKLFSLISALSKPKTVEDKRLAGLCDAFYGIEKAREGIKVSFNRHEGARIEKLLTEVVPDEADLEVMHLKIIRNDLIPMVIRWVKLLRKTCHDASEALEQCPDYVIGLACTRPGVCKSKHEPCLQGILLENVNNVVSSILLDDLINKEKVLPYMAQFVPFMKVVFDEMVQQDNCEHLYSLFYPKHCHPVQVSERINFTLKFVKVVRIPEVERQMKWYVKSKREESGKFASKGNRDVDRRANTDIWLQVWNVHRLFDERPQVMEDWVAKEEKYCNDTWKADRNPLGMLRIPGPVTKLTGIPRLDKGKSRIMYMSYMRNFFDSFSKLYKRADALEAFVSFNRFIGAVATHPVDPLIPSISNIISLLEVWLTISLAILAKVEKCTVVIPASYLAQLNYYDALCSRRFKFIDAFLVISQTRASQSAMQKLVYKKLEYMVDLICAYNKFKHFKILSDAFADPKCLMTGEAERAFVFVLVMLCNVGPAFSPDCATDIRQLLRRIPQKSYPPRLAKAIESINAAKGIRDALVTLQTLLLAREDESCYQCEWMKYNRDIDGPGLGHIRLDPGKFLDLPYQQIDNAPARSSEDHDEGSDVDKKYDPVEDVEITEEDAERLREAHDKLEEQQEMDDAARKIQNWARHIMKKMKLLRAASVFAKCAYYRRKEFTIRRETARDQARDQAHAILGTPHEWVEKTLESYTVNESECGICGVILRGKPQLETYKFETAVDASQDDMVEGPASPVARPVSPHFAGAIDSLPSKEEHEASLLHQERLKHFNTYKSYLLRTTYPVIRDRYRLEQTLQKDALHYKGIFAGGQLIKDDVNKQRIDLFGERLVSSGQKLYLIMEDIQKRHAWEQMKRLEKPIQELVSAVYEARQVAAELETQKEQEDHRSQASPSKQSSVDAKPRSGANVFEEEADEYPDLLEVTQEPEKGFQQVTARQKRKQKSKWSGSRLRKR